MKQLQLELSKLKDEVDIKKTISVGIADIHIHSTSVELLRRADKALYKSKSEGKDAINTYLYENTNTS